MNNLKSFTGSEGYTNGFMGVKLTDGVAYVAKNGASWLISDMCVILKVEKKVVSEPFVAIKFNIKDKKANVSYEDGNDTKLYSQKYKYTDFNEHFEEKEVIFFYTDGVLMLSGEY
jgi:hypothetical protein